MMNRVGINKTREFASSLFSVRFGNCPKPWQRLYCIRGELKRRNVIEPIIGYTKNDGLMRRNHLKGTLGDAINLILCDAGQNLRLILRHLRIFCLNIQHALWPKVLLPSPCRT